MPVVTQYTQNNESYCNERKEDFPMFTNDFKRLELSRLGFGTMCLPVQGGNASNIDEKQVDDAAGNALGCTCGR